MVTFIKKYLRDRGPARGVTTICLTKLTGRVFASLETRATGLIRNKFKKEIPFKNCIEVRLIFLVVLPPRKSLKAHADWRRKYVGS